MSEVSALLGPIGGIMIADYDVLRRRQLHFERLYRADGDIVTRKAQHRPIARHRRHCRIIVSLPNLPGFLRT